MNILKDSVIELKSRSITYSAKLMDASRPSEIYEKVKKAGLGLEENVDPPKRIVVKK
jgi:cell division protein FtsL